MNKTISILIIMTFIASYSFAQKDSLAIIEVSGIAEMEVAPDYSIVSFELSEYNSETKQTTQIVEQEKELFSILKSLELDEKELKFNNFGKNKIYKRKTVESHNSKWYYLKINDLKKLIPFNTSVNKLNLTSFSIDELNSSKIDQYKREIYSLAINNAKEKAEIILKAVNKKIGYPIEIKEIASSSEFDPVKMVNSTKHENYGKGGFAEEPDLTIGNIKLKYKLNVKFRINQ